MTRTLKNDDHQIVHAALETTGDGLEIVLDRRIEIDRTAGRWSHDDLFI